MSANRFLRVEPFRLNRHVFAFVLCLIQRCLRGIRDLSQADMGWIMASRGSQADLDPQLHGDTSGRLLRVFLTASPII